MNWRNTPVKVSLKGIYSYRTVPENHRNHEDLFIQNTEKVSISTDMFLYFIWKKPSQDGYTGPFMKNVISKDTQAACAVLKMLSWCQGGPECQVNISNTITLNHWHKARWIHTSMQCVPNSDYTIQIAQQKARFIQKSSFCRPTLVSLC